MLHDRRGERFRWRNCFVVLTSCSSCAKEGCGTAGFVYRGRKETTKNDNDGSALQARFKSTTTVLGQGMLVVVPYVDSGYVASFMVVLTISLETGVASFWFAKILRVTVSCDRLFGPVSQTQQCSIYSN